MKQNVARSTALIVVMAVAFGSCGNLFQQGPGSKSVAGTGSLTVGLRGAGSAGRTIVPAAVLPADLVYDLSLTRSGYTTISLGDKAITALSVSDIALGDWSLTVTGKKGALALFGKTGTVTIVSGANAVTLVLEPLRVATGSFDIKVTWPAGAVDSSAIYWSSAANSLDVAMASPYTGGGATSQYTSTSPYLRVADSGVASGDYYGGIILSKGDVIVATVIELVRVYDNQTSSKTIALTAADFSQPPAAPSDCYVSFPGGIPNFVWSDNSNTEKGFNLYAGNVLVGSSPASSTIGAAADTYPEATACSIASFNAFGESSRVPCTFVPVDTLSMAFGEVNPILDLGYHVSLDYGMPIELSTSSELASVTDGWTWYLDGIKVEGETGPSYYFNATGSLDNGTYLISAAVTYQGVAYSGYASVRIDAPPYVDTYTVSYSLYADGGEVPIDPNEYASGETVTVKGNEGGLWLANRPFKGWTLANDGSGPIYGPDVGATNTYTILGDVTFYPRWTSIRKSISRFQIIVPGVDTFEGVINQLAKNINVEVYGALPASYVALFNTDGAQVSVGGASQVSGSSQVDFSLPVLYTVTAEDGSTADYTVSVTVGSGSYVRQLTGVSGNWSGIAMSADGQRVAIADRNSGSGGYIFISSDGGKYWTPSVTAGARNWYGVAMSADGRYLAACVNGGYIYTSADFGDTWTERASSLGNRFWFGIAIDDDGTQLAAVDYTTGYIYTSPDGGANWTQQTGAGIHQWGMSVSMNGDGSRIATVASNTTGDVYLSTDYGATWATKVPAASKNWLAVALSESTNRMVAVASGDYIYVTTDGSNWNACPEPGAGNWVGVTMSDDGMKITACEVFGGVWHSNDGGASWQINPSLSGNWSGPIASNSSGNIYIVAPTNGCPWKVIE